MRCYQLQSHTDYRSLMELTKWPSALIFVQFLYLVRSISLMPSYEALILPTSTPLAVDGYWTLHIEVWETKVLPLNTSTRHNIHGFDIYSKQLNKYAHMHTRTRNNNFALVIISEFVHKRDEIHIIYYMFVLSNHYIIETAICWARLPWTKIIRSTRWTDFLITMHQLPRTRCVQALTANWGSMTESCKLMQVYWVCKCTSA